MARQKPIRLDVEQEAGLCPGNPQRRGVRRWQRIEGTVDLYRVEEARVPPEPLLCRHRLVGIKGALLEHGLVGPRGEPDAIIGASALRWLVENDRRFHVGHLTPRSTRPPAQRLTRLA